MKGEGWHVFAWMMEKNEGDDYMLYALLNGGAPYLIREAAYPNTDGAFEGSNTLAMQKMIKRSNVVCALHEKVGKCEMIRHEMVGNNPMVQKTVFSDGTMVTVDFEKQSYTVTSK